VLSLRDLLNACSKFVTAAGAMLREIEYNWHRGFKNAADAPASGDVGD
jgi:hypothetical protein